MTRNSSTNGHSRRRTFRVALLAVGLVGGACLWLPVGTRLVARIDRLFHDELLRRAPGAEVRDDFVVLGIDDASLGNFGATPAEIEASPVLQMMQDRFPWDRRVWAAVIDRLADAGARAIVIDLILSAPSNPEADRVLTEAIERHRERVILPASVSPTAQSGGEVFTLLEPYDPFLGLEYDTRVGFANFQLDPVDGMVRSARYTTTLGLENSEEYEGEDVIPSLAAQIIDLLGESVPTGQHQLGFVHSGRRAATDVYRPISLCELFMEATWEQNFRGGEFFKDKVVIVGPVAPQFQDIHPTPVGPLTGPQLHLQAATCGIQRAFLEAPNLSQFPFWMAAGAALLFFPRLRRPMVATGAAVSLTAALILGAAIAVSPGGLLVPVTAAAIVILLTFLATQTEQLLSEQFERRRLRTAFRRLVSRDVADRLVENPQRYQELAEGSLREVVVLFSDVRGFTSRSESQRPEDTVAQLNEYLGRMVEVVFRNGGTLDKFIGDAVMAHWGALDDGGGSHHSEQALKAAREMQTELKALNVKWRAEGREPMKIGIGVHRGMVVVGEIGSQERSEFGVIGDAVNLCSRLEGVCKPMDAELIYSEQVAKGAGAIDVGKVRVKGRQEPVRVFAEGDPDRIQAQMAKFPADEHGIRDLS